LDLTKLFEGDPRVPFCQILARMAHVSRKSSKRALRETYAAFMLDTGPMGNFDVLLSNGTRCSQKPVPHRRIDANISTHI
jgi:hypothetical protein